MSLELDPLSNYKIVKSGSLIIGMKSDGRFVSSSTTDVSTVFNSIIADIPTSTTPTTIEFGAGTFPARTTMTTGNRSNLAIIGRGGSISTIAMDSDITGNVKLFDSSGVVSGSSISLTANANFGATSVTVSTGNSALFSVGDWILIRSNKAPDSEFPSVKVGEIQKILGVDTGTGIISLEDRITESYTTADSASIIKVLLNDNISISNLAIRYNSSSSTISSGVMFFRLCSNLRVANIDGKDLWWSAFHLSSCLFSKVDNCNVDNVQNTGANVGYGVVLHAATRSTAVEKCSFRRTRHAVTGGGQSSTNFEGVVTNCTVTDCVSETSNTSHYDCHQAMKYISFKNCHARGGIPATTAVHGFQNRSPKTSYVGCTVSNVPGAGIYAFGVADHMVVSGCSFNDIRLTGSSTWGDAIYLDDNIQFATIVGNKMVDCANHAVYGDTNNDHSIVVGNNIINCDSSDGNVRFNNGDDIIICNNRFRDGPNRPIQLGTSGTNFVIIGNDFTGMSNTSPSLLGTGHRVENNIGYNPVGTVSTPFPATAGVVSNVAAAQSVPTSNTVYTIAWSPKTIIISGGTVSSIAINGVTTGLTAGVFKLHVGETINVTHSSNPTVTVYAI